MTMTRGWASRWACSLLTQHQPQLNGGNLVTPRRPMRARSCRRERLSEQRQKENNEKERGLRIQSVEPSVSNLWAPRHQLAIQVNYTPGGNHPRKIRRLLGNCTVTHQQNSNHVVHMYREPEFTYKFQQFFFWQKLFNSYMQKKSY